MPSGQKPPHVFCLALAFTPSARTTFSTPRETCRMPGEQMTHHNLCVAPAFPLARPPSVHHGRNSKCEARSCPITVFEWLWHALRLPGAPSVNHGGTPNMRSNYVPRHGFSKDIAVTPSARTTIGTPRETLKMLNGQIPPLSFGVALARCHAETVARCHAETVARPHDEQRRWAGQSRSAGQWNIRAGQTRWAGARNILAGQTR